MPTADRMVPLFSVPDSVMPMCWGTSDAWESRRHASMVVRTSLAFMERTISPNPKPSIIRINPRPLSTSASGVGPPCFSKQMFFKRAGIDADADRDLCRSCRINHFFHLVFCTDIARIDPDLVRSGFNCGYCKLVLKMNVRDKRDLRTFAYLGKRKAGVFIRDRNADNGAAGGRQFRDLSKRGLDVFGRRIGHGLDDDRAAAADGNAADDIFFL